MFFGLPFVFTFFVQRHTLFFGCKFFRNATKQTAMHFNARNPRCKRCRQEQLQQFVLAELLMGVNFFETPPKKSAIHFNVRNSRCKQCRQEQLQQFVLAVLFMGVNFFETPPNKQQCTLMHETIVASGADHRYNNLF